MSESASIYARSMIESLLHIHALTNMHRSSNDDEYRRAAADWLSTLESQLLALKRELASPADREGRA